MTHGLTGELLRPLVDAQEQTACRDCETPTLPGDLNIVIEPDYDDRACVSGFGVTLLCNRCFRPITNFPRQRRHLRSVD